MKSLDPNVLRSTSMVRRCPYREANSIRGSEQLCSPLRKPKGAQGDSRKIIGRFEPTDGGRVGHRRELLCIHRTLAWNFIHLTGGSKMLGAETKLPFLCRRVDLVNM